MNFAEGYAYHDIRQRRVDVDREWPARSEAGIAAKPSPFVAWAEEWTAVYDEQLINSQMEHEEQRARLAAASKTKARGNLIAKGRDVVHRWRTSDRSDPFEIFASKDRGFLDVQPHLGNEYQAERIRDSERIIYGAEHDDYRSAMLLRELARIEKEWGLA
jgi:hypothetical protein